MSRWWLLLLLVSLSARAGYAQDALIPAGDPEPIAQLDAQGPTALVTALQFSADGKTIYAAGFDKVVHAWQLDASGKFVPSRTTFRVPIGPGVYGAINALALSADSVHLAVAGKMLLRQLAGFRQEGWVRPRASLTDAMWQDEGIIYVYNTLTGDAQPLRGHRGQVLSLTFVPKQRPTEPTLLVSTCREWDAKANRYQGSVCVWHLDAPQSPLLAKHVQAVDLVVKHRSEGEPVLRRVGLTAWRVGAELKQIRVALAWQAQQLQVWDVAQDRLLPADLPEGKENDSLLLVQAQRTSPTQATPVTVPLLLSGSFDDGGLVRVWNAQGPTGPRAERGRGVNFQTLGKLYHYPRALAGLPGYVAVILRTVQADTLREDDVLRLLRLSPAGELTATAVKVPLWPGVGSRPVLAADPTGKYLLAAGHKEHELLVFKVADLLAGRTEPAQKLRSLGESVQQAYFVKKGDQLGLALSTQPSTAKLTSLPAGALLFALSDSRLSDDTKGWQLDLAQDASTKVQSQRDEYLTPTGKSYRSKVTLSKPGRAPLAVELADAQEITALAHTPTQEGRPALLAIAVQELGESRILLYHGETGVLLRHYVGHQQPVHSLAFAKSGPFLVSAGLDQQVCVWSVLDLHKVLAVKGQVSGLAVKAGETGVTVTEATGLTAKLLQVGDIVQAIVEPAGEKKLTTAHEFYKLVTQRTPGTQITVRVQGRGLVALPVAQGSDERMPLFTLFLTQAANLADRRWLVWNPVGPYDASDALAESYLVWHKNTGEAQRPVRLANAREYREENYKQNIVSYLIAHASTAPAIEAWLKDHPRRVRLPAPLVLVQTAGKLAQQDELGRWLVNQPACTLAMSLAQVSSSGIRAARWQLESLGAGTLTSSGDGNWQADLSALPWKRGEYRLTLTVTPSAGTQEVTTTIPLLYKPSSPQLGPRLAGQAESTVRVEQAAYTWATQVQASHPQQKLALLWSHTHLGKEIAKHETQVTGSSKAEQPFKLRPGENVLKLRAQNADAPAAEALQADTDAERDWLVSRVYFADKTQPAQKPTGPQVQPLAVESLGLVLPLEPGQTTILPGLHATLSGILVSEEPIAQAEWAWSGGTAEQLLLEKSTVASLQRFKLPIALLKPGQAVSLTVRAKTVRSDWVERILVLEARPSLPRASFSVPTEKLTLAGDFTGKSQRTFTLPVQLDWGASTEPCTAQLLLDGEPVGQPVALAPTQAEQRFEATLPEPKLSARVRLRLKHAWREQETAELLVQYARLPSVAQLRVHRPDEKKLLAEVVAQIRVPTEVPLLGAKLNGQELPARYLLQDSADKSLWHVTGVERPVQVGKNDFTLWAYTREGASVSSSKATLTVEPTPSKPPAIKLDVPAANKTLDNTFSLKCSIESASVLKEIVVLDSTGEEVYRVVGLEKLKPEPTGYISLLDTKLLLQPGANIFKVQAHSETGEVLSEPIAVTRLQPPVRILLDRVICQGRDYLPTALDDGRLTLPKVPVGKVTVEGRLLWLPENDAQLEQVQHLRMYVNGTQQARPRLKQPDAKKRERFFSAEVLLTRQLGNVLEVGLPERELKRDALSRPECVLDCQAPEPTKQQQLHLLAIDFRARKESEVRADVLRKVGAEPSSLGADRFRCFGYADGGRLYGPLTGAYATPERVNQLLHVVGANLAYRAQQGAVHDVFVLYIAGREKEDAQDHFFGLADDPVSFRELAQRCRENLGAQIVWFDVHKPGAKEFSGAEPFDNVTRWPYDPHLSYFRHSSRPKAEQPALPRLLNDLGEALTQSQVLAELAQKLSEKLQPIDAHRFATLSPSGTLVHDRHLATGQKLLPIGTKQAKP